MTSSRRVHRILAELMVAASPDPREATVATPLPATTLPATTLPATTLPALLCAGCLRDLPVTGVAITLRGAAGLDRLVAATDGPAAAAQELQFQLGEGPGIDALRRAEPVLCDDLAGSWPNWSAFAAAAADAGVAAMFAFPLQADGIRLGVMSLYRETSGRLDDETLTEAIAYAQAATAVLLHLQALAEPMSGLHPDLTGVIADRAAVDRATGMVAAQADVTPADALMLLRARAYSHGVTLSAMSRDVLERRVMFGSGVSSAIAGGSQSTADTANGTGAR